MKKIGVVLLMTVFIWNFACPCSLASAKTESPLKTVQGTVKNVDYVGSQIILMNISNFGGSTEMMISVSEDTKILRDGESIVLPDIEMDDILAVTFRETSPGTYEAVTIDDETVANG